MEYSMLLILFTTIGLLLGTTIGWTTKNAWQFKWLDSKEIIYYCSDNHNGIAAVCTKSEYEVALKERAEELKRKRRHSEENGVSNTEYDYKLSIALVKPISQHVVKKGALQKILRDYAKKGILLMPVNFEITSSTYLVKKDFDEQEVFW